MDDSTISEGLNIPSHTDVQTSNTSSTSSNIDPQTGKNKRGRPPKAKNVEFTPPSTPQPNKSKEYDKQEAYGEFGRRFSQAPPSSTKKPTSTKSTTQDEIEEEKKLIDLILKYYKNFPRLINDEIIPGVPLSKLREELERIKTELGTINSMQAFTSMDIIVAGWIENQAKARGIPLHGLAAYSQSNQAIVEDELKELNILYGNTMVLHPAIRYLYKFAQRIQTVMQINNGLQQQEFRSRKVSPDSSNKYKDL